MTSAPPAYSYCKGLPPGNEANRCYWSNPDAEQLRPYLHRSQVPVFNLCSPAKQRCFYASTHFLSCRQQHAQTNASWASINHQISSPAVHACEREMERVLSEHCHYVSLNKLLPPPHIIPTAHNLVSSLSDTICTNALKDSSILSQCFTWNTTNGRINWSLQPTRFAFQGLINTVGHSYCTLL